MRCGSSTSAYNALEQIGIVLPLGGGSLMIAVNSTTTDRILGVFSGLAHIIGQLRARDALEAYFAVIREMSLRAISNGPGRDGPLRAGD